MDVTCAKCYEPIEVHHLLNDEVHETSLSEAEIEAWLNLDPSHRLQPKYREAFAALGWKFGGSLMNILQCPYCKDEDTQVAPHILEARSALEDVLGDDVDGLAVMLEDFAYAL